jgi:hypothetical protein
VSHASSRNLDFSTIFSHQVWYAVTCLNITAWQLMQYKIIHFVSISSVKFNRGFLFFTFSKSCIQYLPLIFIPYLRSSFSLPSWKIHLCEISFSISFYLHLFFRHLEQYLFPLYFIILILVAYIYSLLVRKCYFIWAIPLTLWCKIQNGT